jgi:peptide chain release factor subunit 1
MTTTVTDSLLRELAAFRSRAGCALSIYVDLDPSATPTPPDAELKFHATLDTVKKVGERVAEGRGRDCRLALREDLSRIQSWWGSEFDRDGASGLAIFASSADDFFRALPLPLSAGDATHVGGTLLVTPIAGHLGDDGSLVVLVSRERGTVYRLEGARLVELLDDSEEQPGRHDQGGWSQARFQRHIETLVTRHLKTVAADLDRTVRRLGAGSGIVVVAPEEARAELERQLPHEVRNAIIGSTSAEAHVGPSGLLEVARPFLVEARARSERDAVERWREAHGRGERSAAGWRQVLEAASDGRVEVLLLTERVTRQAWECPECGRAWADGGKCPLDGTKLEEVPDGSDAAIRQTLAHSGTFVRLGAGTLADDGPAALLRY